MYTLSNDSWTMHASFARASELQAVFCMRQMGVQLAAGGNIDTYATCTRTSQICNLHARRCVRILTFFN
jgi:hypothetical protein